MACGVALGIEQVELQFGGHHRVVAGGLQPLDGARQHVARVGQRRRQAARRVHRNLHLGGGRPAPGLQLQAAGQREGPAVGVGDVPDQAGGVDILAADGQAEDAARQRAAVGIDRAQLVAVQELAARHAAGVDDEQFDALHVRVGGEEGIGFREVGEAHG